VESARTLRAQDGGPVLMHGYGPVAKTLLHADLLSELHLWIHPHLAGVGEEGDVLLDQGLNKRLALTDVRTLGSGVVVLTLRNPNA
jgi:dihydrofolate reductase